MGLTENFDQSENEELAHKARILLNQNRPLDSAKACVEEALPYIKDEMQFDDASTIYMAACEVAMAEKQWQKALDYALRSVHPDSTATYADKGGYMLLAEIYTELGQKGKARAYMNKVYDMMNRYATDHYQSGLSQMEVLYETRQKEAQIAQLARERRQHLWVIGVGCLVLVVTVLLLFYFQLAHRRQKALLAAKVALETETKERRILARDLHDGLGGMLSLLRIRSLTPDPSPKGEGSEYIKLLDNIIVELRRMAHHLMPEELLKNGLVSALNDFAVSVPGATFQFIQAEGVTAPLSSRRGVRGEALELTLYRCAYELVNNALKHAEASHINIQLMLDISMPGGSGINFCQQVVSDFPRMKILAITIHDEYSVIQRMLDSGAHGYVLKSASVQELLDAITAVYQGERYISHEVEDIIRQGESKAVVLTTVERSILRLICEGHTNPEIAVKLSLSTETVNWYRKRLLTKFGAKNAVGLVTLAIKERLL